MCLPFLLTAAVMAQAPDFALTTPHIDLRGHGAAVTSLRLDPTGGGAYGPNLVAELTVAGLEATDAAKVETAPHEVRLGGLARRLPRPLRIEHDNTPVPLTPGHSLGQSFTVKNGGFSALRILTPTWNTRDAGLTMRLRREGPAGELVREQLITGIQDNQQTELTFDRQPPGAYYVEISAPVGTVGWWSDSKDVYPDGTAFVDGQPQPERDRSLEVDVDDPVPATLLLSAAGPELTVRCAWETSAKGRLEGPQLLWRTPWTKDGYDVSPNSGAVFSHYYTDRQRYLPAEQMKRQTTNYGPGLEGSWLQMAGYAKADVRVSARGLAFNWSATKDRLTHYIPAAAQADAAQWIIEARPPREALPADWPAFFTDDAALDVDLNRLLYERVMSYPGGGSTPWVAWSGLTGDWYAGPRRAEQRAAITGLVVGADGYVHTWGAAAGWPFPDNKQYDTRHFDTNARFIQAAWLYYCWTRDKTLLEGQADRLRRAMAFQLHELHGADGLIITASKDVNGRHKGIGDNYWDILPFGHLDAYVNAYFLYSLRAMGEIEKVLGGQPPVDYDALYAKCRAAYDRTFWDEAAGRYIGCVDIDGKQHDYGFTFVNLEALYHGQGDAAKARRIYDWLENGTTWQGKRDIYSRWVFAPRTTTIYNPRWGAGAPPPPAGAGEPWWMFGWGGTAWEEQCQDGGAIFYTSFYDLMDRRRFFGVDNAWKRFSEILARYREPDRLCGGSPLFRGEHPQQQDPGSVGLDIPFPESGLVPCWFVFGLLGAEPDMAGLHVRPALPTGMNRAGVRNLAWGGEIWTLTVTRDGDGYRLDLVSPQHHHSARVTAGGEATLVSAERIVASAAR
jgi:hypothetical protein